MNIKKEKNILFTGDVEKYVARVKSKKGRDDHGITRYTRKK